MAHPLYVKSLIVHLPACNRNDRSPPRNMEKGAEKWSILVSSLIGSWLKSCAREPCDPISSCPFFIHFRRTSAIVGRHAVFYTK